LCEKCGKQLYQREDDKKETVLKRLEVYEKNTAPLIEYYQEKGLLIQIDGGESVEKTFENLQKALATK
jgi:adenylate kinase